MNQLLLKQTAILSAIMGGVLAVLTLIPFVRNFSFMALILFVAAIVLVYMKKHDLIGVIDLREGAVLGGVIGFVSFIAFSIVFIPLVAVFGGLFGLMFGGFFKTTYNAYIFSMYKMMGVWVTILLTFFVSIVSALMNAFAGLATAYVYEILSGMKKEENENVDFEIKE